MLSVHANTVEEVPQAIEEVKEVIRKRHKNQDDFFMVRDMREGMAQLEKIGKVIKNRPRQHRRILTARRRHRYYEHDARRRNRTHTRNRAPKSTRRKAVGHHDPVLIEAVAMCAVGGALGV